MSETSRPRQFLPAILMVLALVAGCAPVDATRPNEDSKAGLERWDCGDYFDGCGLFTTDCVTLTADLRNGTGEVKFGEFVESAWFEVQGLERRWNWCLNADGFYDCAFVISVDGRGRYFNFRGSDGQAKPRDLFKCERR